MAGAALVRAEGLDKGHRILQERGLQIQAQVFWSPTGQFDLTRWRQSNFTTVNWQHIPNPSLLGPVPGIPWGRWTDHEGRCDAPTGDDRRYRTNLVSLQFSDEQDLNDPAVRAAAADWFRRARATFPDTLLFTNQINSRVTVDNLRLYMKACRPDMLCFDTYPFGRPEIDSPKYGSPVTLYRDMAIYRKLGLEGNDGTGQRPIPCGMYLQTFMFEPKWRRYPSESEMRLNQFAAWTFGFKFVSAFVYSAPGNKGLHSALFTGFGDSTPTPAFARIAEINRQSRHLGRALVRLLSTDVRFIPGLHDGSQNNPTPAGLAVWSPGADPYITNISVANLGSKNKGLAGDVLVGYFKPLPEAQGTPARPTEIYVMITNGLTARDALAVQCRQRLRLEFDFKTSGISSLQRLSRETGQVEPVPLVSRGGSKHHLDLVLDGGTGDLFKFNTGAPFVGTVPRDMSKTPLRGTKQIDRSR